MLDTALHPDGTSRLAQMEIAAGYLRGLSVWQGDWRARERSRHLRGRQAGCIKDSLLLVAQSPTSAPRDKSLVGSTRQSEVPVIRYIQEQGDLVTDAEREAGTKNNCHSRTREQREVAR